MNRKKRISLGHNMWAFDEAPNEAPDAEDDEDAAAIRAGMDAFVTAYKAARDRRRAARDAGRAEVDHRNDFKSGDRPGAIDHALGLDSASCFEFEEMFETNCHTGPGQADFSDILGGRRA